MKLLSTALFFSLFSSVNAADEPCPLEERVKNLEKKFEDSQKKVDELKSRLNEFEDLTTIVKEGEKNGVIAVSVPFFVPTSSCENIKPLFRDEISGPWDPKKRDYPTERRAFVAKESIFFKSLKEIKCPQESYLMVQLIKKGRLSDEIYAVPASRVALF